jgi:hypothetical protein
VNIAQRPGKQFSSLCDGLNTNSLETTSASCNGSDGMSSLGGPGVSPASHPAAGVKPRPPFSHRLGRQ